MRISPLELNLEQNVDIRNFLHKVIYKKYYIPFFDTLLRLGNIGLSKLVKNVVFWISRLVLTLEQNMSIQTIICIKFSINNMSCTFCSKVSPNRDIHKKLFLVTLLRPKTPKMTQRIQKMYRTVLVENFMKAISDINILL